MFDGSYSVIYRCRSSVKDWSLYVLEHEAVASKPVAARLAMETLGQPWRGFISAAADWRPGVEFRKLDEMLDFINLHWSKGYLGRGVVCYRRGKNSRKRTR